MSADNNITHDNFKLPASILTNLAKNTAQEY